MKFYGVGIVWNPEEDKALCQFTKGELETEDTTIINKLIELGYKHDVEAKTEPQSEELSYLEAFTDEELKELAKDAGIKGYATSKRETLISKLKEE